MHALKIVLLIIALVLLVVSVATPMWLEATISGVPPAPNPTPNLGAKLDLIKPTITAGLWENCATGLGSTVEMCQSNINLSGDKERDAILNSVRALSLLSVVLVAFAILCCFICKNKAPVMVLICIALLSCISTIGVVAGKMSKAIAQGAPQRIGTKASVKEGYSFWLQVAAACVLLLVFVMKLMVKGKKM